MTRTGADRGVSAVVGIALLVALTVALAVTVAVFATGFADETPDSRPSVGQTSGALYANDGGDDTGIVEIKHVAGDAIAVAEVEIAVDASDACGRSGRLVDLPLSGDSVDPSNVEGDDVFDEREPHMGGPETSALHESRLVSGERFRFRIPDSKCAVRAGDEVDVRVVHLPSNSVIVRKTLTAT